MSKNRNFRSENEGFIGLFFRFRKNVNDSGYEWPVKGRILVRLEVTKGIRYETVLETDDFHSDCMQKPRFEDDNKQFGLAKWIGVNEIEKHLSGGSKIFLKWRFVE